MIRIVRKCPNCKAELQKTAPDQVVTCRCGWRWE